MLTEADLAALSERHRRELHVHCYRMLASFEEAEDAVQETLLRALHARDTFAGGGNARAWLYRIATNACLDALKRRGRRPQTVESFGEVPWIQPYADSLLDETVTRETIELAFLAVIQLLPPRQRAVVIARDVMGWSAAETSELLDTSVPAVNSALQRAHAQLAKAEVSRDTVDTTTLDDDKQAMLDRYVKAFWDKDIDAIVSMLTRDAIWEMPPFAGWYQGNDNIGRLVDTQCPGDRHDMPMLATWANGQPAFGLYMRQQDGSFTPFHLQVLTLGADGVEHVAAFFETTLFAKFGLPERLPADYADPTADPVPSV
jgi:RNA polymerase sigma-70 factor, ECF subfamily